MLRTHTCGELRKAHEGKQVILSGWVDKIRIVGSKLTFLDLRDRYGLTQIIIKEKTDLKLEYCVQITGEVKIRKDKNPNMETGEIEILSDKVEIFNTSP